MKLQPTSQEIWEQKYCLRNDKGEAVDIDVDDMFQRVAKALSRNDPGQEHNFLWALRNGAVPAGRVLANAGAEEYKPATSTINCTVSDTIPDSMEGILNKLSEAGMTLKTGAGIGYDFSTLRPKGAMVRGPGASTSGPLSFMEIYDRMCFTVSSAGGRRGAQMGVLDIRHPDIKDFITAKQEDGRLRQFNLSVLITDTFIEAVKNDLEWKLIFPVRKGVDTSGMETVKATWPKGDDYEVDEEGLVVCKVYETVQARDLWELIMKSTYNYAEPGFLLGDRANELNNNWFCEDLRATNPCGEQNLPPYGACLLGSINLTKFVEGDEFNFPRFRSVVSIFTRMLDNVVEFNRLPLEQQQQEILEKRRHGMGFFGLGSVFCMLGMRYGDDESVKLADDICRCLVEQGYRTGVELAKEKGVAPIMNKMFLITPELMRLRPEMADVGINVGDVVAGHVLWARFSRYIQKLPENLQAELLEHGCRFTHHSSIAPTGTIAFSIGNNASNGIEPSFAHHYTRNVVEAGKKSKRSVDVYSYERLHARQDMPEWPTASDITPQEHIRMQAVVQKWIDSSISKTINVDTEIPFEEFKNIYMDAYEMGLKGCTTFRYNPEAFTGVLVRNEDLEKTRYKFILDNGETIILQGDEQVEYDGEHHTASNLYDALKEGYYGKF